MIRLYTSRGCVNCKPVKQALQEAELEYEELSADYDYALLVEDCAKCDETDPSSLKSAPVMVMDGIIYDGADCIVAIDEVAEERAECTTNP